MQPSFVKNDPNDMTRATQNGIMRTGNNQDLSVLISDSTSRKARGVINNLNKDVKNRPELLSMTQNDASAHFLSGDDSITNRSHALVRGAHNILGMSGEGFGGQGNSMMNNRPLNQSMANIPTGQFGRPVASARPGSGFRLNSAVENSVRSNPGGGLQNQSRLPINPNIAVRNQELNQSDNKEVNDHMRKQAEKEKAEKLKAYVDSLAERVERLDNHAKDFKHYEKAELDAKDSEIKTWVITQKKVDEERRLEIENRLRTIFQDKMKESTGYAPSEGFLLSIDFMYNSIYLG